MTRSNIITDYLFINLDILNLINNVLLKIVIYFVFDDCGTNCLTLIRWLFEIYIIIPGVIYFYFYSIFLSMLFWSVEDVPSNLLPFLRSYSMKLQHTHKCQYQEPIMKKYFVSNNFFNHHLIQNDDFQNDLRDYFTMYILQ